jgi:hypothetical protein
MLSTRYSCQILTNLEFSRQIFEKKPKSQRSCQSIQWESSCSMRTHRDMKLIVAFRNFAKAPNKKSKRCNKWKEQLTITSVKVRPSGVKQVYCNALQTSPRQIRRCYSKTRCYLWTLQCTKSIVLKYGVKRCKLSLLDVKQCLHIGSYLFITPTYAQFLQYYYFTPIRISTFRMPSSGGHSVKSIDFT